MKTTDTRPTVVLGLGNPLMGDDGLGIAALEMLRSAWSFDPPVDLVDGGTWGMQLLPTIEAAERLLLVDAIDNDAAPGAFIELGRHELPRLFATRLSPHQVDLRDVLALAELRDTLPAVTVALGLQPARIEMSTTLSPHLADRLETLVRRVVWRLEAWGHEPTPIPPSAPAATERGVAGAAASPVAAREPAPSRETEPQCTK